MECMEKTYKLSDDSHPKFDRYDVLLNGEVAYQECFMKGEDPNIFLSWRKWSHKKRSHYIRKCIEKGESYEDITNRLKIDRPFYVFYKDNLWCEGKTISEYRKMISKATIGKRRGPYNRRNTKGVEA